MPKNSLRVHEVGAGLRSLDIFQFDLTLREKLVAHPFATGYRNTSDDDLLIAVFDGGNRINDKNEFVIQNIPLGEGHPPPMTGLITHLGAGEHLSHGGWNAIKLDPVPVSVTESGIDSVKFSVTDGTWYLLVLFSKESGAFEQLSFDQRGNNQFQEGQDMVLLRAAEDNADAIIAFDDNREMYFPNSSYYRVYKVLPWGMNKLAVII